MLNKSIAVSQQGTVIAGIVKGLSPEGGLVVHTGGVDKTLFAGDVTVLPADGLPAGLLSHAPGN
jgi:biotin-(acetyl-CoA carboxylase) ligase